MNRIIFSFLVSSILLLTGSCQNKSNNSMKSNESPIAGNWKTQFNNILPLLGHRNWVLLVDRAYPLQNSSGIRYIETNEELPLVLDYVLSNVEKSSHVKPIIYRDAELDYISSEMSSDIEVFKETLSKLFAHREVKVLLHDEVFGKLDQASKLFEVIVLKTNSTIAYSSVFIELDCGYWSIEKENELRNKMK